MVIWKLSFAPFYRRDGNPGWGQAV